MRTARAPIPARATGSATASISAEAAAAGGDPLHGGRSSMIW
jgi:hypothetical protein